MGTLYDRTISSSYTELLKTTSTGGVTATLDTVEDGDATASALQISSAGIKSTGTLEATGDTTLGGSLSLGGVAISATGTELNYCDGVTSSIQTQLDGKLGLAPEVSDLAASAVVLESEGIASNDNDTTLPTSAAVKDYVDTKVTGEDLDVTTDSGTIAIDLDGETLTVTGGTGIDTSATGNAVTAAIDSTVTTLTGSQTLTNKTLTSPVLDTGVSGTAIKDEDDMASDSATHLATQQSIKAYVNATVGISDIVEDTSPQLGGNLDVNGKDITSVSNGNIPLVPNGTGKVILDGLEWPTSDGSNGQVIQTDGSGALSFVDQTGGGGGSSNSFVTIALSADGGSASGDSSVVADSSTDTLALKAGSGVTVTGDADNDAITISATDTNTNQLTEWKLRDGDESVTVNHDKEVKFAASGAASVELSGAGTTGDPFLMTIGSTDTNTTYTAGDGLDLSGTEFSADLKANGGVVVESTELAIALGASSITGTLAATDGGTGLTSISTLLNSNTTKSDVGLGSVEDTALSTWAGTTNVTTLGTISSGTWQGTDIAVADGGTGASTAAAARTNLGLEIGANVQEYDGDIAKTDTAQAWTLPQRAALTTDNDGDFDLSAKQNFFCTPGAAKTLTFSNPADGQSGFVKLVNASAYTHLADGNTKIHADDLTAIGAAGTFLLGYLSDGTDTWVTVSKALA